MSAVFRLAATSLGQIASIFSRLVAALLESSPETIRNGFPSTISCVALPCFFKWGAPESVLRLARSRQANSREHQ